MNKNIKIGDYVIVNDDGEDFVGKVGKVVHEPGDIIVTDCTWITHFYWVRFFEHIDTRDNMYCFLDTELEVISKDKAMVEML